MERGNLFSKAVMGTSVLALTGIIGATIYHVPAAMRAAEAKAALVEAGGTVESADWRIMALMAASVALSAIVLYRTRKA